MELPSLRQQRILRIACCVVYFASYMTRVNYAAAILAICADLGLSRPDAGIAVTVNFFSYGIGQIINGVLGDRIAPKWMIFGGLAGTVCCNLLMPSLNSVALLTLVWCANGYFQSMLWPPMVRLLAENLDERAFVNANVEVLAASSTANIMIYLIVPVCVRFASWRMAFYVSAGIGVAAALLWLVLLPKISTRSRTEAQPQPGEQPQHTPVWPLLLRSGAWIAAGGALLQGLLRDGITTWLPSCVADLSGLDASSSILTAVMLPIFAVVSVWLAARLRRFIRTETASSAFLFVLGAASCFAMLGLLDGKAILLALLMGLTTGCMHGVNLMLISRVPMHFGRYGCVSGVSGILNAFTYVGSAISTYGVAIVSERFGWQPTILLWGIAAALGAGLCLLMHRRWVKFCKNN
ncbi:MAG: MFS transporter, partial [Clostridia bacterium]|nr:MFS transporter [Clostridia bacterium]